MEYVYAALLLHAAGKNINEENLKKVLEAAGVDVDVARVKALVSALKEINIDEAIEQASAMPAAAPAAAPAATQEAEEKKEEEKKEEEEAKREEEAAAGLASLFG